MNSDVAHSEKTEIITHLSVKTFKIPCEQEESDGTLKWNSTTMVLVLLQARGKTGLGYTYADSSTGAFIINNLSSLVLGENPMKIEKIHGSIHRNIRNEGNAGIAFMALSAVDIALWDLKARILNLPLSYLLGMAKRKVQIYGSGGFTSYNDKELANQLSGWAKQGISHVKMKIGRDPEKDLHRIRVAREAIGNKNSLFVDANGAFTVRQALDMADKFDKFGIQWYEEPVSSANLKGLAFIRNNGPSGISIAAGEYGYGLSYFRHMLESQAVDVLQADATRCGGITGFMKAGHLSEAFNIPFSFHCAPSVHLHAALSLPYFWIGEYFHDHVRIERMLFDGVQQPVEGYLSPELSLTGHGLSLKTTDAEKFLLYENHCSYA